MAFSQLKMKSFINVLKDITLEDFLSLKRITEKALNGDEINVLFRPVKDFKI